MRIVFNGKLPLAPHPYQGGPSAKCLILTNIEKHHEEGMTLIKKVKECLIKKAISHLFCIYPLKDKNPPPQAVDISFFISSLRFDLIGAPIAHNTRPISTMHYTILFPKPETIHVLESRIGKLPFSRTFPELQKVFQIGPLYAKGGKDPYALYDKELMIEKHQIEDMTLYPWQMNEETLKFSENCNQLLLLGIKKTKQIELIYFTGATHQGTCSISFISTYGPSSNLTKIYFTSLNAFKGYTFYPSHQQLVFTHRAVEILARIKESEKKNSLKTGVL